MSAPTTPGNTLLSPSDLEACLQTKVPDYALVFFDHLHSEYLPLRSRIHDQRLLDLLDSLQDKRMRCELTWSDIYAFDLALIDVLPLENLIRKAYDSRSKYRSIAGQKEYDEYLASKPPDLTAILIKPSAMREPETTDESTVPPVMHSPPIEEPPEPQIPDSAEIVQRVLRADIRYLLSKFYLYYAMLPMREGTRERLTKKAVIMTLIILGIIFLAALVSLGVLKIFTSANPEKVFDLTGVFGVTVGAVACAGIIGGCVSMLQRIQSAPSEGDALFNLASLTNGWIGIALSPLYGAIFASVLFMLFAAGILRGSVFPTIETPGSQVTRANTNAGPTPSPSPSPSPSASPSPTASPDSSPSPSPSPTSSPSPISSPSPTASASLTETERTGILQVKDFLKETGPKDGVSFALLMIWSFIAGFAERLVPDTLNRLVAKTEAIQGTNT